MWIQTSYNTRGNKYYNGDGSEGINLKNLGGNYAGIGYTWDEDNQIFLVLNNHTLVGLKILQLLLGKHAPITYPSVTNDGQDPVVWTYGISWNETVIKQTILKVGKERNLMLDGSETR